MTIFGRADRAAGGSSSRGHLRRLRLWTNEFLNVLHGFGEAGGQAIWLRSLEASHGFVRIVVESPDANHDFELREPLPDLLAHGPRRCERIRRKRRDARYVAVSGFNRREHFV